MITVLVVDDSAFMRKSLAMMLESDPEIKVVDTARDGKEGLAKVRQHNPDLVTLDIEMPVMDGLTALREIMSTSPRPVLMVSSLTTEGAKSTMDALAIGAVDFIPKQMSFVSVDIVKIREDLVRKVKSIVHSRGLSFRMQRLRSGRAAGSPASREGQGPKTSTARPSGNYQALVIGISTGGPFALQQIIPKIDRRFPYGIVIIQHMPPKFTQSLAERLNGMSAIEIREAVAGDVVTPGLALLAPGGMHLTFSRNGGRTLVARLSPEPKDTLYRPCVDVTMESVVQSLQGPILSLIMTGMGKDGLEGSRKARQFGGYVMAQDEESCVVYGMPRAIVDSGLADNVLSLDAIPPFLNQFAR